MALKLENSKIRTNMDGFDPRKRKLLAKEFNNILNKSNMRIGSYQVDSEN